MNLWRRLPRSPLERLAWGLPLGTLVVLLIVLFSTYRIAKTEIEVVLRGAVEQEILGLESVFHDVGIESLIADIDGRVASGLDPAAIYLLIDARGQRLAGNLPAWPAGVPRADEAAFRVPGATGDELQGKVFSLFGHRLLLVGRRSPLAGLKTVLARNLAIAGSLVVAGSIVLSAAALVPFRRRLAALHEQARLIREGDLSQRVAVRADGDELDALGVDINATFAELERAMNGAKHISSMIAHDMRRPITALRYQLDDALQAPGLAAPTTAAIARCIAATDEILATFTALLQLARVESRTYVADQQPLAFDALVRDAVETYEPVAQAAGMALVADIGPAFVRGDRNLWFQLLQNLLENAIAHGGRSDESRPRADVGEPAPAPQRDAGRIEVTVRCDARNALLVVRDHGPGVPEAALPRLFERFYRADSARTQGGSGVGLALVQAIAELHGGAVRAENAHPGLRVCVTLPRVATQTT